MTSQRACEPISSLSNRKSVRRDCALFRPGSRSPATDADDLSRVHDAKTAIGQNDEEFTAVGHEEKVVRGGDRERASVRELNFKWFERRVIAHFPQCFQPHAAGNLPLTTPSVNVTGGLMSWKSDASARLRNGLWKEFDPPTCAESSFSRTVTAIPDRVSFTEQLMSPPSIVPAVE